VVNFSRVNFAEIDSPWAIDRGSGRFTSPVHPRQDYQRLIFDETFRDGTIAADISFPEGEPTPSEGGSASAKEPRVGAIVFRFRDPKNYYYAGIGAYSNKFFISRMIEGRGQKIVASGSSDSIAKGVEYRVEVRCSGNLISLAFNNIVLLQTFDDSFGSGQWGLQSWRSRVRFSSLEADSTQPRCFVIMPFASEFNEVFRVIRETVESQGYECVRADERYIVGTVMNDVNDQIEQADLIVADLTGRNPNVFYEVGYAAALRKPVIQIAQSSEDLPFDVRHIRTFPYSTKILGDRKLAHNLAEAIRATTGSTPMTSNDSPESN
jgi:hypothetical protein